MVKSKYLNSYQIDHDDFILVTDATSGQNPEPPEIVVVARVARNVADGGGLGQAGFSLVPFLYGRDYGEGAPNSDPFGFNQLP